MRFIFLFEVLLSVGFLWFVSTQMVLPAGAGEKWFPFFRKRRKLEHERAEAVTNVNDKRLKDEISSIKKGEV